MLFNYAKLQVSGGTRRVPSVYLLQVHFAIDLRLLQLYEVPRMRNYSPLLNPDLDKCERAPNL